jgi:hypothetical protein
MVQIITTKPGAIMARVTLATLPEKGKRSCPYIGKKAHVVNERYLSHETIATLLSIASQASTFRNA